MHLFQKNDGTLPHLSFFHPAVKLIAAALFVLCALAYFRSLARPAVGPPARKAVVAELFTSEGCSSCPPADALLGNLRQDLATQGITVIPLGFHVDYWNSLGWKDRFSSAQFSRRQEQYARALKVDGPYTPQMVVNGAAEFVGSSRARAYAAIAEAASRPDRAAIELSLRSPDKLGVKATSANNGAVVMLAITEDNLTTNIGAGENSGRRLRHAAVVRELRQIGVIQNGNYTADVPLVLDKQWKPADLRAVIFIQSGEAGEVLGAASVPLDVQPR
jgi:hypothetical protein